ncbi:MAG: helicase-associated domain-containing protein [Deltaproteobacteria bacterium]|nr:helicase-associated domain-containing protein [Deltaproteobacteria bacterium]
MATSDTIEPQLDLGEGQDLDRLAPSVREALMRGLVEKPRDRSPSALHAELRKPAAVTRLLSQLPDEALYPAAVLAFIGRANSARLHEHVTLRLGADAAVRALDALERAGLCIHGAYDPRQTWMPPTVQLAVRPQLASVLAHPSRAPSMDQAEHDLAPRLFEDEVLLAAMASTTPKLTQSGEVFKRELLALIPLLQRRTEDPVILAEELDLLCELGLVAVGSRLEVPPEPIDLWRQLDRGEKLRRHVVARARLVPTILPFVQLLYLAGPVALLTLVELADLDASAEPTLWRRGRARTLDGATRVDFLLMQPGLGIVDLGSTRLVGMAPSLRSALAGEPQPEPEATGYPHLLPSLEAIVPPECPLPMVISLARFLDVTSVDTVAHFKLTRESVERAARRGQTAEQMLEVLTEVVRYGVPENVARALRDFSAVKPNRVHFVEGPVVVAEEESARELLRGDEEMGELVSEVAPGVFEVQGSWAAGPTRRRLTTLGLWQSRDEDIHEPARLTRWDNDDATRRLTRLRQGLLLRGPAPLARRARAAVALAEIGPGTPGAAERVAKAQKALEKDPKRFETFLASLDEAERERFNRDLEAIVDPDRPLAAQLDRLDRLAPDWVERSKPKPVRKKK